MSDKSTSSERATAQAPVTPAQPATESVSAARKIYSIVKYGDPILEKPTSPVTKFDADLEQLSEDMFASMYAAQGVGLAAPQIGLGLRLAVVDVTGGKNPEAKIVLANPEVIHAEGEKREENFHLNSLASRLTRTARNGRDSSSSRFLSRRDTGLRA